MNATTVQANSIASLQQQIKTVIAEQFTPTLAVVFTSINYNLHHLQQLFNQHQIDLIGASSAGEIIDDEFVEDHIVVLLMDMNRDYYHIECLTGDYKNSYQISKQIAQKGQELFTHPAFLSLLSITINGEQMIAGIEDTFDQSVPIFGGIAGDNADMENTYILNNKCISKESLLMLIIDYDKIEVNGLAANGWRPLGTAKTITKAEGNRIYTIDDKPALNVFTKFFGLFHDFTEHQYEDLAKEVSVSSTQYPLQVIRNESHVMRAPLQADNDGSLILAGPVQEGEQFKFSVAPGFEIVEEIVDIFENFQEKEQLEVDALILFSCKARHLSLGPLLEEEVSGIYEIWNKPMIGFLTYGEIGRNHVNQTHFFNETCSLVSFRERK